MLRGWAAKSLFWALLLAQPDLAPYQPDLGCDKAAEEKRGGGKEQGRRWGSGSRGGWLSPLTFQWMLGFLWQTLLGAGRGFSQCGQTAGLLVNHPLSPHEEPVPPTAPG